MPPARRRPSKSASSNPAALEDTPSPAPEEDGLHPQQARSRLQHAQDGRPAAGRRWGRILMTADLAGAPERPVALVWLQDRPPKNDSAAWVSPQAYHLKVGSAWIATGPVLTYQTFKAIRRLKCHNSLVAALQLASAEAKLSIQTLATSGSAQSPTSAARCANQVTSGLNRPRRKIRMIPTRYPPLNANGGYRERRSLPLCGHL